MKARLWVAALAVGIGGTACFAAGTESTARTVADLRRQFADPPRSARLQTWYHCLSDCLSPEGIAADFAAMKEAGISTAHLIFPSMAELPRITPFMSKKWLEVVKGAIREAKKNGLDLCFLNCPGWSSSGGPWIDAEHSMKILTAAERDVTFQQESPVPMVEQPRANLGYYRDIAVWAFPVQPSPVLEKGPLPHALACNLTPEKGTRDVLVYRYARPFDPEAFAFKVDDSQLWADVLVEGSADGRNWTRLGSAHYQDHADPYSRRKIALSRQGAFSQFRVTFSSKDYPCWFGKRSRKLLEAEFTNALTVADPSQARENPRTLPSGSWRIVRLGYTTSGKGPAPATVEGLECDKFDRAAFDLHWDAYPAKLLALPGAKDVVRGFVIDSYEAGKQNWSANFADEFRRRRGHEVGVGALAEVGYQVGDTQEHARREAEFKATVAELFAENYFDRFCERCRECGIRSYVEPYPSEWGRAAFDATRCLSKVDVPMAEFCLDGINGIWTVPLTVDGARRQGANIIAAEAFTTEAKEGRWLATPAELKRVGDTIGWLGGVNQLILHSYVHQPFGSARPGLSLGRHGTQLNRNSTWWPEVKHWAAYVARGQALLQAGRFERTGEVSGIRYLQRRLSDGTCVFFFVNMSSVRFRDGVTLEGTGVAEEYDAVTGDVRELPRKKASANGTTEVLVDLEPSASTFVVLRPGTAATAPVATWPCERSLVTVANLTRDWTIVSFSGANPPSAPLGLQRLSDWTASADEKLRHFAGRAVYEKKLELKTGVSERMILDLGEVHEIANVWVNDKFVGCLWKPPFRIDISAALATRNAQRATLKVEIVNTWPNRLIGDAKARAKGAAEPLRGTVPAWVLDGKADSGTGIFTWSNFLEGWTSDDKLLPAGLIGPVRLCRETTVDFRRLPFNNPGVIVPAKGGEGLSVNRFFVRDYDGDGLPDILCQSGWGTQWNGEATYLLRNPGPRGNADPVFSPSVKIPDEPRVVRYWHFQGQKDRRIRGWESQQVDYDGDGIDDWISVVDDWTQYEIPGNMYDPFGNWLKPMLSSYVYWGKGRKDGSCGWGKIVRLEDGRYLETCGGRNAVFHDWDGDGDLDLIRLDFIDTFSYFENVGSRTNPVWTAARHLRTADGERLHPELCIGTIAKCDWDGDGKMDLLMSEENAYVSFVRNTGRVERGLPVFEKPRYLRMCGGDVFFGALACPWTCDWDGDGDEDILCGNSAGNIAFIENLSGKGVASPKWAAPVLLCEPDGKPIRIQAGPNGSRQGPIEAKWGYVTLSVADWDGDGRPDIMANTIWGRPLWWRNVGTRRKPSLDFARGVEVEWESAQPEMTHIWFRPKTFGNPKEILTHWRTTPVMADFDGDGLVDLLLMDHEGFLAFWRRAKRDGRLVLLPPRRVLVGKGGCPIRLGAAGRRKFCVADWDGDGRTDLIWNGGPNAQVMRQLKFEGGKWFFDDPVDLAALKIHQHDPQPAACDFDGDGVPDLLMGAEDGYLYYLKNERK